MSNCVVHFEIHAEDPAVPGVCWGAYFIDPFGNIVGLHQEDAGAA